MLLYFLLSRPRPELYFLLHTYVFNVRGSVEMIHVLSLFIKILLGNSPAVNFMIAHFANDLVRHAKFSLHCK
jgi:hypothetical protein